MLPLGIVARSSTFVVYVLCSHSPVVISAVTSANWAPLEQLTCARIQTHMKTDAHAALSSELPCSRMISSFCTASSNPKFDAIFFPRTCHSSSNREKPNILAHILGKDVRFDVPRPPPPSLRFTSTSKSLLKVTTKGLIKGEQSGEFVRILALDCRYASLAFSHSVPLPSTRRLFSAGSNEA